MSNGPNSRMFQFAIPTGSLAAPGNERLDALVASSAYLRNAQGTLTKAPRPLQAMPIAGPVSLRTDERFRFGAHTTRARKSALPIDAAPDRFSSELYPLPAPYVHLVQGADTRWLHRGTEISPAM